MQLCRTLVSGGKDSAIKLWDTTTGTLTHTLQSFQGSVNDLVISSDNNLVTSRKLSAWDLNSGQILRTLDHGQHQVTAVEFMVSADDNHMVKIWDLQHDNSCGGYFDSNCNALCFTKDESTFCSGHDNGKITFNNI